MPRHSQLVTVSAQLSLPSVVHIVVIARKFTYASIARNPRMIAFSKLAPALFCLLLSCTVFATDAARSDLNNGFQQMYNLDFAGAHQTFSEWERGYPQDPLGPASNAAAYLFSEFNRLKILESDLFTDDQKFEKRSKLSPDPGIRAAFQAELQKAREVANEALAVKPQDSRSLLALVMANGLEGDYVALIEKKNLAALGYMKNSRSIAERLLAADPSCYDAYLAVGVENYLLSLNSAPVRWILRLGGAQTDREEGLQKLRLTATKGHYLAPYARLLLAVAALRDKDRNTARQLLAGLSQEFPQNELYRKELARIQP